MQKGTKTIKDFKTVAIQKDQQAAVKGGTIIIEDIYNE